MGTVTGFPTLCTKRDNSHDFLFLSRTMSHLKNCFLNEKNLLLGSKFFLLIVDPTEMWCRKENDRSCFPKNFWFLNGYFCCVKIYNNKNNIILLLFIVSIIFLFEDSWISRGWSGGAMVLGKLPVLGHPTIWMIVGQGPIALAVGADGGCLDIFALIYPFSPLSPSLWEMARYRLKYCLKGPINPKQPTNQLNTQWAHNVGTMSTQYWCKLICTECQCWSVS